MKLSEISLDETIKFYYEMDESYDNIDSDNKKKDDKKTDEKDTDKVNTKRHLTENEMYMSLAHLLYMKELEFDELNEEEDKKNDNNNKEIKQFTSEKETLEYVEKIKTRLDKKAINRLYKKVERYFIGDNGAGEKGGLYNRLIENLGLDLRLKESDNSKEKFNKLKLLKQIYSAERIGVYKAGTLREDDFGFMEKISIVDIISSPKLKNIKNKYGDDSICADEFETIYDNIKSQVKDAEKKEKEIYAIFEQWQKLVTLTFFDTSLSSYSPDKSCRIKEQRDAIKRIPVEFENFVKDKKTEASEAGVIERFFIMLVTARIRAEINDYCKIVFSYSEDETAQPGNSNDILSLFSAYNITDNNFLKKYVISEFYNTILSAYEFIEMLERGSESDKIKLWQLILLRNVDEIPDIRKMEPNVYKYASDAERLNNVAKFWKKEDNKNNFKMALERWCILFRELIFIKITDQGIITTDGRGWGKEKGRHRTLTAIIKSFNPDRNVKCSAHEPSESGNKKRKPRTEKEDRREAHSNMALRHRLDNRFLLLYSSPEIVDCRNDMVRHILSIAENVFSYDTVKDIKRVNKIMFYITSLYSISYADLSAEEFDYDITLFYGYSLGFFNKNVRRLFLAASKIDEYFVLSDRPDEVIEAERDYYMLYPYNNKEGNSEMKKFTLNEYKEKYKIIERKCKIYQKARDTISTQLYYTGKYSIENHSTIVFGLDGKHINMRFSCLNSYALKKFIITDIEFETDIQKVLLKRF